MIALNQTSRTPIYQQIREQVLAQIACGLLSPHQQLPGVRSMAIDLGINPNTVMKAYVELEREGFIYSVAGKGSYVSEPNGDVSVIRQEKLAEVKEVLSKLRPYGIPKEEIMKLVELMYREEETR
ncbi:MAG: GntR family transcriptional regulator [Erysipelotrichaceae bacterium]